MEDILALRFRQIHDFGHTPEADASAPQDRLPRLIEQIGRTIREDYQFRVDAPVRRRHAVKLAALCCALIDLIDTTEDQ